MHRPVASAALALPAGSVSLNVSTVSETSQLNSSYELVDAAQVDNPSQIQEDARRGSDSGDSDNDNDIDEAQILQSESVELENQVTQRSNVALFLFPL